MDDLNVNKDELETPKPVYIKKSQQIYRINKYLIILILVMRIIKKPMFYNMEGWIIMLIVLTVLGAMVLAPVGLFYSWKSYKHKEEPARLRFKYMIRHAIIFTLALFFIISTIAFFASLNIGT